jgi:DNA-binding NarL/FixJ family response regulator
MNGLRILLADSNVVCRRGLHSLLISQPGWSICSESKNGRETVERTLALKPDVVILDLELTELNGIEATRRIKRVLPLTEILFYTVHDEEHIITEALRAGVRAHVLKSDGEDTVIEAVDALSKHLPFFSTPAAETLLDHVLKKDHDSSDLQPLTEREREIITLLADAKTNKEIGAHLHISVKTVEAHRSAVMRKLGFKSITELVRYAIRNRFIQP